MEEQIRQCNRRDDGEVKKHLGYHHLIPFKHLSAARLQSFVRSSQKDLRLSSAAIGLENGNLAFTGGEILAKSE